MLSAVYERHPSGHYQLDAQVCLSGRIGSSGVGQPGDSPSTVTRHRAKRACPFRRASVWTSGTRLRVVARSRSEMREPGPGRRLKLEHVPQSDRCLKPLQPDCQQLRLFASRRCPRRRPETWRCGLSGRTSDRLPLSDQGTVADQARSRRRRPDWRSCVSSRGGLTGLHRACRPPELSQLGR